jgi:NAD-dependent dihydropyrimidine dehydrogenase PreA subunit
MFLSILCNYLEVPLFHVVCISDNAELIRRCKAHLQYKEPFPKETLRSEYDVTEQIYRTQAAHNIKATFYWVKGHQDNNKTYEELPLEAQLNIDADQLAGEFQDEYGTFRPLVHVLPSCPAMLAIRGISITSNYRKQLIRAYVEPQYIQHLQYKFQWSDETIETISWKCLALAIQRIRRNVLITKVCNDLLPTSVTLQKMKYQHHNTCILCQQCETRDHILRCQAPTRIKWRRQYIKALQHKFDILETDFALGETLCTTIAEWLETGNVDVSKYPIKYANAIISQDNIGWRHLFGGKLSQEWLTLHNESTNITKNKKQEGYIWGASIVETTLRKFIDLWEIRNEEVHGKTIEQQENIRKTKLSLEVRKLNSMKDQARPSDMCLFHENEEEYIEHSTAQMIATWVSSHRRAILNSVKRWALTAAKGSTSILQWVRISNEPAVIDRVYSRQRNKLINNGRKKVRLRNQTTTGKTSQLSISSYYTLANR